MRPIMTVILLFVLSGNLRAQDQLLQVLETELNREVAGFATAAQPPYFIAYTVSDLWIGQVESAFGSLMKSDTNRNRILTADVRVGDYAFDDTHPMDQEDDFDNMFGMFRRGMTELPIDNKPEAIQHTLWKQTQSAYETSLENYKSKRSLQKPTPNPVGDFSKETPSVSVDPALPEFSSLFDQGMWNARMRKLSAPFNDSPYMVDGTASIEVGMERRYIVSSEGTRIAQNRTYAYLTIRGSMRAADADIVPLHLSYFAFDPKGLPSDEVVLKDIAILIGKLNKLRVAPVAEPYTGPAILHARAAGVFFHEIFGHRVEGHRLKDKTDGQTFKGKINEQVLPTSLSVVFDPTLSQYNGVELNGHYRFDDEGVKGQRVKVVNRGVLETFLMSRTPIENFTKSNGHGRAAYGASPVSRQSNLIIENEKAVAMPELRKMPIAECKKQKRKYGYLFMDVVGGFTNTQRYMPNAFNIFPTEVYRIHVDGRPDELVRGVDLIGTPLSMFAEIEAADGVAETFTGFCGAESGNVPVTAISPSLFVKRIETQKKTTTHVEESLMKRPGN